MKELIVYSLIAVLLSGCVSASSYRDSSSVAQACNAYKVQGLTEKDSVKQSLIMEQYDQCQNKVSQDQASNINLCFGMYFVGGFVTFGLLWLLSPICLTAGGT